MGVCWLRLRKHVYLFDHLIFRQLCIESSPLINEDGEITL